METLKLHERMGPLSPWDILADRSVFVHLGLGAVPWSLCEQCNLSECLPFFLSFFFSFFVSLFFHLIPWVILY